MKRLVIASLLLPLCACSTGTKISLKINEEIDAYLLEREKKQYVQVVYPEELRQFSGNRDSVSCPVCITNSIDKEGD